MVSPTPYWGIWRRPQEAACYEVGLRDINHILSRKVEMNQKLEI